MFIGVLSTLTTTWLKNGSVRSPKQEELVTVHCCSNIWFNNELYAIESENEEGESMKMNGANVWRNVKNKDKVSLKKQNKIILFFLFVWVRSIFYELVRRNSDTRDRLYTNPQFHH